MHSLASRLVFALILVLITASPAFAHGSDYLYAFAAAPITAFAFILAALFAEAFSDKRILSTGSWAGAGLSWVILVCLAFLSLSDSAWLPYKSLLGWLLCLFPLLALFTYLGLKIWQKLKQ